MPLLLWSVQSSQEEWHGYLLPSSDVAPIARLCPLLHGPRLCLLSKLSVGPHGGRGAQMSDAPRPLRLLPPARSQSLGAVPRRVPLEPHTGRRAPRQARGG